MPNIAKAIKHGLDPVTFAREALDFQPDKWQEEVLRDEGKMILNCCRQSGKSTITAVKALHRALFFPGSLVLLISASMRQSSELFKKVTSELNKLPDQPRRVEDNRLSVTLETGSRLVSLPSSEATVRGFSGPSLVVIDEASRVSNELYYSIWPMLAVGGGQIILLSTPFGKRGFFHDAWVSENDWKKILITAEDCPRITKEFLEEEKKTLGEWWFEQEYFCKFKESVDSLFSYDDVQNALSDDIKPLEV
jgi:hypothetical protein